MTPKTSCLSTGRVASPSTKMRKNEGGAACGKGQKFVFGHVKSEHQLYSQGGKSYSQPDIHDLS